jgi:hypothetical protein
MQSGEEYEFPRGDLASPDRYPGRIGNYQPVLYGEKEGGGTQVMMLAGVPFNHLGLPDLPPEPSGKSTETIQHTLYQGLIAPILLFAGLAIAVRRSLNRHPQEDQEDQEDEKNRDQ